MKHLVAIATIILGLPLFLILVLGDEEAATPNLDEAGLLANVPYPHSTPPMFKKLEASVLA